ncbi:glycine betaine/proline transport system permease protein [Flavimobilis soli]|uniref:Glycine betaine/proline transport system permease protein n=1 Tax=Flavimobilis soli TaxID=442709 RepID=A0A2A9EFG1_9MICO|nr:proline/glycine betaine ABC transporter permease [Flavimobilis soli]PFG37015.1 glycine betaine/proline transport system permease protein [Flavimobilis soli]
MSETMVPRVHLGDAVESFVDWVTVAGASFFTAVKDGLLAVYDVLDTALAAPPAWAIILVIAALAWFAKGWLLALGSAVGLAVISAVDQWDNAMDTLALVILASGIALLIAIPLGIWAARNRKVSRVVRPVLDFMQTMPAFVYLIPTVVIFLTGVVPGLVATIIFALAPGVRFTELGIRQVDSEVVEAGHAFGATEGRILRQIQLPLALPTIMAGVNQVIMLSLSMVVIAGLTGAAGLGREVVSALQRVNVSLGFEAGLAVVILAMILDRTTAALSDRAPVAKALKAA